MKRRMIVRSGRLVASSSIAAGAALAWGAACADPVGESPTPTEEDAAVVLSTIDGASEAMPESEDAAGDVEREDAARTCSEDGFCPSKLPVGQDLRGVWGDGAGIVWAISGTGDILRWDGASWSIHQQGSEEGFAIWGSGPTDIWVSTATSILRGQGPSSAQLVFTPVADLPGDPSIPIKAIWGTSAADVWAVGAGETVLVPQKGRVLHYDGSAADGGSGWTLDEELSSRNVAFDGVWGSGARGVWVHGRERDPLTGRLHARLFRRAPGATGWATIELPEDPYDVHRPFPGEILAGTVTPAGTVLIGGRTGLPVEGRWHGVSSDDGATYDWTFEHAYATERAVAALWSAPEGDVWAVGEVGLVARWTGTGWQQARIRASHEVVLRSFRAIWGTSTDDFWVVGDEIALHKTKAGKP